MKILIDSAQIVGLNLDLTLNKGSRSFHPMQHRLTPNCKGVEIQKDCVQNLLTNEKVVALFKSIINMDV